MRRPTDRTRALTLEQVRALVNALTFARYTGRPLNAMLTIAWQQSGLFTEADWAHLQTALVDRTVRHLQRRGIQTAFVWTRERVHGRGAHTHLLAYLGSQPARIAPELVDYLTSKFQFEQGGLRPDMGDYGAHTPVMQAGLLRYVLKGYDHRAFIYAATETVNIGAALGIDHRGQQGIIDIKRAGTSQNIGAAARKRAEWAEIRDIAALTRALNPDKPSAAPMTRAA